MDSFEQELKIGFLEEASQLLADAEQCFLLLESNPQDMPTLEKIFRIAHNIKGSSKAVGFDSLGAFTHEFESFMLKCKSGQIAITGATVSLLLKCNDHVKTFVDMLKADQSAQLDSAALIAEIHGFNPEVVEAESSGITAAAPSENATTDALIEASNASDSASVEEESISADDVRLVAEGLSAEANSGPQLGEVVSNVPATVVPTPTAAPVVAPAVLAAPPAATATAVPPASGASSAPASDESIRVSLARLEKLIDFVGEMVILQTVLKEQAQSASLPVVRKTIHQMGKVTKEVQDISMSLRMVPLKQTFQKMQRIVRDTSGILGKKVQLVLQGEDTEVDKTVLEALSDPLVHLIRNAVDHGIEMPQDRAAKGKPEQGQVTLKAYHQSGKLVIEIQDNGGGIPADRLRQKALEKGILKPGQVITDKEAIHLIFHPGFSTKAQVTEVSGRGVGMDVVKTNIDRMQGDVLVETVLNQGSTFKIILPLTLAIIDGTVVRCGEERYIIPLVHVHESVKPDAKDLKFATGVGEVLLLRGENLPVLRLSQALGKRRSAETAMSEQIAIIIRTHEKPFAALVDEVVGQHQVVIKKLGAEMQNIRGYSGSAILGDGKPALILELGDLVQKPANLSTSPKKQGAA